MGTNATKKAASKIVAILLAALMLISVMPMTAFAATSPEAKYVVEGLTLKTAPVVPDLNGDKQSNDEYAVGDKFTFDGMELVVTYRSISEIEALGDKALRKDVVLKGYNKAEWTKYGIGCNFKEGQVLTIEDNLKPLTFTFGPNSSLVLESECYIAVFPSNWAWGDQILGFYVEGEDRRGMDFADGEYLLVANNDTILSSLLADEETIGNHLAQDSLAAWKGIKVDGSAIADVESQLKAIDPDLDLDEVMWEVAEEVEFDEANNYVLNWTAVAGGKYIDVTGATKNYVRDNDYPLSMGSKSYSDDWTLTDVKGGKMYITIEDVKDGTYIDVNGKEQTKYIDVNLYLAVSDKGYAYLTADETAAASINVYRVVSALVNDIEIAKNPNKMSYIEGEEFSYDGMVVNLMYNDNIVVCVPSALFDVYGIDVYPDNGDMMTVKQWNDMSVYVSYGKYSDETDTKLQVAAKADGQYTLLESKLVDGNYVIAWIPESDNAVGRSMIPVSGNNFGAKGEMLKNIIYTGTALTDNSIGTGKVVFNDLKNTEVIGNLGSNYNVETLGNTEIDVYNKAIGQFNNYFVENSGVDSSMIWTVKFDVTERAFTIQNAETGKYLNRSALTYKNLWVAGINANEAFVETVLDTVKPMTMGDLCADSYWVIDGSYDTSIESPASLDTDDNYYLANVGPATVAVDLSAADDKGSDNFYFFKTASLDIIGIEIADPIEGKYNSGDKLALDDLVAKITYANGEKKDVAYDDFAAYGITVNYANGQVLAGADNGKDVVVSLGSFTANAGKLDVTDSKADLKVVRMGGADRYETAAIIANNYITALGAEYKNAAVLVNSEQFPDALAGSTLAAALKAPIVITKSDSLNAKTKAVLVDNKVNTVYVLGGNNAIGNDVITAIKALNINVEVIAGANRVETSVAIAKKLATVKGYSDTVIITNGANFADALSVSSAAAKNGTPILYVDGQGTLAADVKTFIADAKATKAVILGGTAAVSDGIAAELKALGLTVDRAAGADRFETSIAIAKYFDAAYTDGVVALATGKDFPDALAGGVYASLIGAPVILVDNGYANADAALYIAGLDLTDAVVFGGTDAVTDATVNAALLK